jgi:hypothetical protein
MLKNTAQVINLFLDNQILSTKNIIVDLRIIWFNDE